MQDWEVCVCVCVYVCVCVCCLRGGRGGEALKKRPWLQQNPEMKGWKSGRESFPYTKLWIQTTLNTHGATTSHTGRDAKAKGERSIGHSSTWALCSKKDLVPTSPVHSTQTVQQTALFLQNRVHFRGHTLIMCRYYQHKLFDTGHCSMGTKSHSSSYGSSTNSQ